MSVPRPRSSVLFPLWRNSTAGWVVTILVLLYAVPPFLCMPPWNDVTLYDMAARAMLRGGVHYRDVFDTNLPGMAWAMAGIRSVFGWSYEALRVVDLVVIAGATAVLLWWVRRAGGAAYTVAWLAAAISLFYPFSTEFNHVQRDPWLLLPAVMAASLRVRRVVGSSGLGGPEGASQPGRLHHTVALSILEGVLWGLAVWVKPHVVIPAAAIWVVSVCLMARRESVGRIATDFASLLAGGLLAGAAGVAWMVGTGAWPYFLDVFFNWNPSYLSDVWGSTPARLLRTFYCFRPWSILHFPALCLSLLALREAQVWSRRPSELKPVRCRCWVFDPAADESIVASRALLAAFYLGWFAQATFLQKGLDYVQVPLLLLGMAMVATHRWSIGFAFLIWFILLSVLLNLPVLSPLSRGLEPALDEVRGYNDPFADGRLLRLWPRCWREGGTPELRDQLGLFVNIHCGTNWEDLDGVARYLRTLDPPLGPGELNCWHDSTHPLYLELGLEPATRFMHYGTALGIRKQAGEIAREVEASRQRYVVSDLLRMTWKRDEAYKPGEGGDPHQLPCWFPVSQRSAYPWNQPIVFRSGRYLVHKVERPLGVIDVPDWYKLDQLGPGIR